MEEMKKSEKKLAECVKYWRRFFLDVAKPKNLPAGWGVNSKVTLDGIIREDEVV